jgi:hypothetical protein
MAGFEIGCVPIFPGHQNNQRREHRCKSRCSQMIKDIKRQFKLLYVSALYKCFIAVYSSFNFAFAVYLHAHSGSISKIILA